MPFPPGQQPRSGQATVTAAVSVTGVVLWVSGIIVNLCSLGMFPVDHLVFSSGQQYISVHSLMYGGRSSDPIVRSNSVRLLCVASKFEPNRHVIAEAGAIPLIVAMLGGLTSTDEDNVNSASALCALAENAELRGVIIAAEPLHRIVALLGKENQQPIKVIKAAAEALMVLTEPVDNMICASTIETLIPSLVLLVGHHQPLCIFIAAAQFLVNLCFNPEIVVRVAASGGVSQLVARFESSRHHVEMELVTGLLNLLACDREAAKISASEGFSLLTPSIMRSGGGPECMVYARLLALLTSHDDDIIKAWARTSGAIAATVKKLLMCKGW